MNNSNKKKKQIIVPPRLNNYCNNCYFNSALQILFVCTSFIWTLKQLKRYSTFANKILSIKNGEYEVNLISLLKEFFHKNKNKQIVSGKYCDADECLNSILSILSEEIKNDFSISIKYSKKLNDDRLLIINNENEFAKLSINERRYIKFNILKQQVYRFLEKYFDENRNYFVNSLFIFVEGIVYTCSNCSYENVVYNARNSIIVYSSMKNISESINKEYTTEIITKECISCNNKYIKHKKKTTLVAAPQLLLVKISNIDTRKTIIPNRTLCINFPLRIIHNKFKRNDKQKNDCETEVIRKMKLLLNNDFECNFSLKGIVFHNLDHYYVMTKHNKTWWLCSDNLVRQEEFCESPIKHAQILLYERV